MSNPFGKFPRCYRLPGIFLAVFGWAVSSLNGLAASSVAISASAIPTYVRPLDAGGQPLPETYVFMEGLDLAGTTADSSTKKMTFDQITRVLAVSLAKQNYFPTRDVPSAKLIIRVYWGTTVVYEDPLKQLTVEGLNSAMQTYRDTVAASGNSIADPGNINQSLQQMGTSQMSTASAVDRNAALLGYQGALEEERRRPFVTTTEMSLTGELTEERYFVVLIAYDYQHLRQKKKATPLWITRLSIRSPGNNFTEAMPTLAVAGANAFGKQLDGLVRVKASAAEANVKLDELKFLGDVKADNPKSPPGAK
jgi:hypothetical protein